MYFNNLQGDELIIVTDIRDRFGVLESVRKELEQYKGSMRWKKSKGREYLFRAKDSKGNGRSLGPRSPENEAILAAFRERKAVLKEREKELLSWMTRKSAFAKAARINRCPRLVAKILRELDRSGMLKNNLVVVGSHALLAYESEGAVLFDSGLLSTLDLDLLWDVRTRLVISGHAQQQGLLDALRRADSSFEACGPRSYRAANKDGFLVDLIKAQATPPWKKEAEQMGADDDLWACPIPNLGWLRDAPKLTSTLIDQDGFPLKMTVPDPRAFALHKLWLSKQPNRKAAKARRDKEQAVAVAKLIAEAMPQYPMMSSLVRQIPLEHAKGLSELPEGF